MQDIWFRSVEKEHGGVVGRIADSDCYDRAASEKAGTTVYKKVPVLLSKIPGSHDVSSQAIKPHNKETLCKRFPGAWEAYEKEKAERERLAKANGQEEPAVLTGTLLAEADFIPRGQLPRLHSMGFSTVEQLASMSDMVVQNMGRGALSWRKKAKEFLQRT
jgi:hypothetical protein